MTWIDKQLITKGVIDMLSVNMGVQGGERILVATDVLSTERWPIFNIIRKGDKDYGTKNWQ